MVKWNSTDANQAGIVKLLRAIPGITVASLNQVGAGVPDILVGHLGVNYLFEIKDPAKKPSARKLTPAQIEFHAAWCGQVLVVETFDEILEAI